MPGILTPDLGTQAAKRGGGGHQIFFCDAGEGAKPAGVNHFRLPFFFPCFFITIPRLFVWCWRERDFEAGPGGGGPSFPPPVSKENCLAALLCLPGAFGGSHQRRLNVDPALGPLRAFFGLPLGCVRETVQGERSIFGGSCHFGVGGGGGNRVYGFSVWRSMGFFEGGEDVIFGQMGGGEPFVRRVLWGEKRGGGPRFARRRGRGGGRGELGGGKIFFPGGIRPPPPPPENLFTRRGLIVFFFFPRRASVSG